MSGIKEHSKALTTDHPSKSNINVFKPSASEMDANRALMASFMSWRSSLSRSDSMAGTNAPKMVFSRLLNAFPATVTKEANALALNAVMGVEVRVGMRIGKTTPART